MNNASFSIAKRSIISAIAVARRLEVRCHNIELIRIQKIGYQPTHDQSSKQGESRQMLAAAAACSALVYIRGIAAIRYTQTFRRSQCRKGYIVYLTISDKSKETIILVISLLFVGDQYSASRYGAATSIHSIEGVSFSKLDIFYSY